MVEFKDSTMYLLPSEGPTFNEIWVNHDCSLRDAKGRTDPGITGGLCASHFVFNMTIHGGEPAFRSVTRDPHQPNLVPYTDVLIFYNKEILFDTDQSHPAFTPSDSGCSEDGNGEMFKCPESLGIRSVRIYSPNRGPLTVKTSEGSYTVPFLPHNKYMQYVIIFSLCYC